MGPTYCHHGYNASRCGLCDEEESRERVRVATLTADNARLRAEVEEVGCKLTLREAYDNDARVLLTGRIARLEADLARVTAEREELRAGLDEISRMLPCETPCQMTERDECPTCGHMRHLWCAGCVARAALAACQ